MLKRSALFGLATALAAAGIVVWAFDGRSPAQVTTVPRDLAGCEVDVGLGKDAHVLWGVSASSVLLRGPVGDRLVFDDASGRFALAYATVLSDEDRFGYGPKIMADRPLILSPKSFSVREADVAF